MYILTTTLTLLVTILLSLTAHATSGLNGPWVWLEGDFTNYQQTLAEPEMGHLPLRYSLTLLTNNNNEAIKAIGNSKGVLMLSQHYYLFDPSTPLRQRVFQFTEQGEGWRQRIFEVAPGELGRPDAWTEITGCRMRWKKTVSGFLGETNPARCFFVVTEQNTRIAVHSTMRMTKDSVAVADVISATTDVISESTTVATQFQRMTYYDSAITFRPTTDDEWREVKAVHAIHDQGVRVGLVDTQSGLELRYQLEVLREGDEVQFSLYDVTRRDVVYQTSVPSEAGIIDYATENLRIRLKPRP